MALVREILTNDIRVLIWEMIESEQELKSLAPFRKSHLDSLKTLLSERRRREWLTSRVLIYDYLGSVDVLYRENGAPYLLNSDQKISISHSDGFLACGFSNGDIGVDIELLTRDFAKVTSRYLSSEEVAKLKDIDNYEAISWSLKEAVYKKMGELEVNFKRDISIVEIGENLASYHFKGDKGVAYYQIEEQNILVYC